MRRAPEAAPIAALIAEVLAATLVVGCCDYVSQPGERFLVRPLAPGIARAASRTGGGLDRATCTAVCGADRDCSLATLVAPPRSPKLRCRDAADTLHDWVDVPPSFAGSLPPDGTALPPATCTRWCGSDLPLCVVDAPAPPDPDEVFVVCRQTWAGGECGWRMPAGRRASTVRRRARSDGSGADPVGAFWASAAASEAEAVVAFAELTAALRAFRAPRALVLRAVRAGREERRHARLLARIARARGAAVPRLRRRAAVRLDLPTFVRENAVEGCVGETVGAFLAAHQARTAVDPRWKRALAVLARDEADHAALAWAVHRHFLPRVDAATRRTVEVAMARAFDAYARGFDVAPEVGRHVGLPTSRGLALALARLRAALLPASR